MSSEKDWVEEAIEGLPPLLTVKEACTVLRTSARNFYRLAAAGRIYAPKSSESGPARLLVPRASIAKYLRSLDARAA